MADRSVIITLRDKQTAGGSIPGSALMGEPFVNLYDGILKFSGVTGGSYEPSTQTGVFEVGSKLYNQKVTNRFSVNDNFIVSGDTGIISTYNGLNGASLSGKFLSGTSAGFVIANISDIQGVQTLVQPGVNITTGGTSAFPTINLVASPSVNNLTFSGTAIGGAGQFAGVTATSLSATTLSGGTILSGGTNLYSIFQKIGDVDGVANVNAGSNITTGGTATSPTINLTASPSVNNLTFSGTAIGGGVQAGAGTFTTISGGTVSGGTFISGGTNLYSIFQKIGDVDGVANVNAGSNITTGGTATSPIINLAASPSVNSITASGASSFTTLSATTFISGSTNLYNIFAQPSQVVNNVNAGSNITTGGTATSPIINLAASPSVNNLTVSGTGTINTVSAQIITATAITDSNLTSGQAVYASTGGLLKTNSGFTYDDVANRLFAQNIQIGSSSLSGNVTIWGDVTVMGQSISAFTSQLYIEDNNIQLNYNPTASTTSTSLGAGWTIQDGSGLAGTDVLFDIRGTATGVANRSFATNLNDIRIRETGTVSSPNGVRVLAENDVLDGGSY